MRYLKKMKFCSEKFKTKFYTARTVFYNIKVHVKNACLIFLLYQYIIKKFTGNLYRPLLTFLIFQVFGDYLDLPSS